MQLAGVKPSNLSTTIAISSLVYEGDIPEGYLLEQALRKEVCISISTMFHYHILRVSNIIMHVSITGTVRVARIQCVSSP